MVIYAVLGTSRPLSVSTTATFAVLAATQLGMTVPGGEPVALMVASATLALLVGAMLVLASILRFGFIANFISEAVLTGFKSGIGLDVHFVSPVPASRGRPCACPPSGNHKGCPYGLHGETPSRPQRISVGGRAAARCQA